MIWNGELHQSVVGSGFLLVYSDCNTFFLSVCVRSSELQCGVHFSVSTSPRVILVGTVVRAAASFVYKVCINSAKLRVTQTWQPQFGLQDIILDGPHKWFRSLTEVPQERETSCAEEYRRTREKIDE